MDLKCKRCGAPLKFEVVQDIEGKRAVLLCSVDASHGPDLLPAT